MPQTIPPVPPHHCRFAGALSPRNAQPDSLPGSMLPDRRGQRRIDGRRSSFQAPNVQPLLRVIRNCKKPPCRIPWMAVSRDRCATPGADRLIHKKGDPPGGTTGRVGFDTGWMRRPCRTQLHIFQSIRSEVADAHVADKLAVHVVTGGPATAAITVVVAVVRGGDSSADNRGADEAGSNAPAPAERLGLSLRAGGR